MQKIKTFSPFVLVGIGFLTLFSFKLSDDFWNDEIYSLEFFTFVPLMTTITDYHVPNNHLFFNLINNIYLKLIGVESLFELMDTPYLIRLLPFLYSALTFVFVIKFGVKFFNRQVALLASIVLVTSIPVYNFGVQVRGYALSALLLLLVIYEVFSYLKSFSKKHWWLTVLFSFLLIYTLPSNLYPVSGVLMGLGISMLLVVEKDHWKSFSSLRKSILQSQYFSLILAIFLGLGICLICYSWIFAEVFDNGYVKGGTLFDWSKLRIKGKIVVHDFFSNRLLFMPLVLIGLMINIKQLWLWRAKLLVLFFTCVMPVAWTFIRGDNTPFRVFSVLLPAFSLLIGVGLYSFFIGLDKRGTYQLIYTILLLFYSAYCFYFEIKKLDRRIYEDIVNGFPSQDMYYQYYAFHFRPFSDIKAFYELYAVNKLPVVLSGCEPEGVPFYLRKFKIPFHSEDQLGSLLENYDSVYVITSRPYRLPINKEHEVIFLSDELSYHNCLLVKSH